MNTKQTIHIQTSNHTEISDSKQQETLKEHSNEFQIGVYPYNIDKLSHRHAAIHATR